MTLAVAPDLRREEFANREVKGGQGEVRARFRFANFASLEASISSASPLELCFDSFEALFVGSIKALLRFLSQRVLRSFSLRNIGIIKLSNLHKHGHYKLYKDENKENGQGLFFWEKSSMLP